MSPIRELTREAFIARFGCAYDGAPEIAARVWDSGAARGDPGGLYQAFRDAIDNRGENGQLAVLRTQPDLGAEGASALALAEQIEAGLDQCTLAETAELQQLNDDYKRKFGFPFVLAVAGLDRERVLGAFRHRLQLSRDAEFAMAVHQLHRIAAQRLQPLIEAHTP